MFALGRSFRGAKDKELLRYGAESASLELEVSDGDDEYSSKKLSVKYNADGRRVCRKNGVCVRSLSEFVGNFRVVLFASPQLSVVRDSGAARRRFLDSAISQLKPVYLVLGYEPMAETRGGYPAGFISQAVRLGITENMIFDINFPAVRNDVAVMICRALDIPIMEMKKEGEYVILDGNNFEIKKTLRDVFSNKQ